MIKNLLKNTFNKGVIYVIKNYMCRVSITRYFAFVRCACSSHRATVQINNRI
jgi:hypothetical protein